MKHRWFITLRSPVSAALVSRGQLRAALAMGREPGKPLDTATYFNFLDSHDGIGLLPIRNIVSPERVENLVRKALSHGGIISYREDADGKMSPYEITRPGIAR